MTNRNLIGGMASVLLLLASCSYLRPNSSNCEPICAPDSGDVVAVSANSICASGSGNCRVCEAPRWYFSNGRYIRCIDEFVTTRSAKACARRSYDRRLQRGCPTADDYRDGYIQAFVDLACGSCGITPAVPPQKYWKANNRSQRGYARAEQWFNGYQDGVCDANSLGRQDFLHIPTSPASCPPGNQGDPYWGPNQMVGP